MKINYVKLLVYTCYEVKRPARKNY